MGQLFFMGWEGTEVTPQIRTLIEDHHLGAILLTTKNLKSRQFAHYSVGVVKLTFLFHFDLQAFPMHA